MAGRLPSSTWVSSRAREGLGFALGPGRAGEVAALAGERVPACVDDDLPGVAALADEALCHTREPRALTSVDKSF